jgi:hypothetical protein
MRISCFLFAFMEITEQKKIKRLKLLAQVDETSEPIVNELFELDDRVDDVDEKLVVTVEETRVKIEEDIAGIVTEVNRKIEKVATNLTEFKGAYDRGELKGDKGDNYILTDKDKADIALNIEVPVVKKVIERTEIIKEQPIVTNEIKEVAIAETAEVLRDKLASLKDDDRLDKSAIKGIEELEEEINKLKKRRTDTVYVGGSGGGRIVKAYDLSSQLNGVLKTFNLPALWRVISVHASSFPFNLRETVDYTWTPQSITFTSAISVNSTLASGQTLTVIYAEA